MNMQSTTIVDIGINSLQATDNGTDRTVTSIDASTAKFDVVAAVHTDSELKLAAVAVTSSISGSPILDGTFFRIVSVGEDGKVIKAVCTACPAGKKPLSGTITAATNFLTHLKVTRNLMQF